MGLNTFVYATFISLRNLAATSYTHSYKFYEKAPLERLKILHVYFYM